VIADWSPKAGQVVLVEPIDGVTPDCLTGLVMSADPETLVIDLGASPPTGTHFDAIGSIFAADALYRIKCTLDHGDHSDNVYDLVIHDIERVQRRATPRKRATFAVSLGAFDGPGDPVSVAGETIDIGTGGCRVCTTRAFPLESDPTVVIDLPDGSMVTLARILEADEHDDRCEYRLVFADIDPVDLERLSVLVAS
jgi:hypothetical protein